MAVKAGQFVTDAEGTIVSRAQTIGVSSMNFPKDTVREVGNAKTVGIIRDIPDLSWDVDSVDMSCDFEALLLGIDPTTVTDGEVFDFAKSKPLDVLSEFKKSLTDGSVINGIIVPYLTLDTVSYKFGLKANASQTFTMRSDAVYYTPGSAFFQKYNLAGAGPYALAHPANPYYELGAQQFVHSLCWEAPDGTCGRLFFPHDWTDTANNFTLTAAAVAAIPAGSVIKATYGSLDVAQYPQSRNDATAPPIRPAALRGKDIDVYIGDASATPTFTRVSGVQSLNADRKVNLDKDEEFGNVHYLSQDYDTADVTGRLQVKAGDAPALFSLIRKLAGVPGGQSAGVMSQVQLPMEIRLSHPQTGVRLKTLYVPDAVFNPPPIQGRVQTKIDVTFDWASEEGELLVYKGDRYGT